jgi:hypothetical protein
MDKNSKAVLRFNNGRTLKGFISDFTPDTDIVSMEETETREVVTADIHLLKAIFFVRSFEGNSHYREKKSYGLARQKGRKIFIKFKDGEDMVGFLIGDLPWRKGFFLSKSKSTLKGFFISPADEDSNNEKVFVVTTSIKDVTVMP